MFGVNCTQENINAGGDVAGHDIIHNYAPRVTWFQRKFQKLAKEIEQDQRYEKTIDDLEYYNTILDGSLGLEQKLQDGGVFKVGNRSCVKTKVEICKKTREI